MKFCVCSADSKDEICHSGTSELLTCCWSVSKGNNFELTYSMKWSDHISLVTLATKVMTNVVEESESRKSPPEEPESFSLLLSPELSVE